MADLEKVIKGLRCLSDPYVQDMDERDCENCKYDNASCFLDVTADALTLLKAQEPKPPRFTVAYDKIFYGCDNCGKSLVVMANSEGLVLQKDLPKYCPECGQAVKWDEPPKEG